MSDRSCRSCRRDLSAFLDEELSSRRRRTVSRHLEGCEGCRSHLEELRLVSRETGRVDPPPPEDLEASILRGLEAGLREEAVPGRTPWRSPLLVGASAVVLAAVVGLGLVGLRDRLPFAPPTGPAGTESRVAAERPADPRAGPVSAEEAKPELEEALAVEEPAGKLAEKPRLATRREAGQDIVEAEGVPEDRADLDQGKSPRSAPPPGARVQRTAVGKEGKRSEAEVAPEAGDLEAARGAGFEESRQEAAAEPGERDEFRKKGEGLADAASGEKLLETGCPGPPVAAPLPGEILGCPSEAGDRPVRTLLQAVPAKDVDDGLARDGKSGGAAEASDSATSLSPVPLEPVPGPLPVPEAAASRVLELLLDLRLAPDGGVLSVEAIPPATAGSPAAAVCSSVARWRFLPSSGEGVTGERRVRMSLRLEPATP